MAPDTTQTHPYLHGHHASVLRSHRWRTAENSAGYLIPWLDSGFSVLDVGCGPGTITVGLAGYVDDGRVVGIDPAKEVLADARAEASRWHRGNVDFGVGDVHDLDFGDGTFDVVHAHQVLQHLRDPVAALLEMRRVCRPGGIVAARDGDYGAMFWSPQDPEMEEWRTLYRRVARAVGGEPDGGRRVLHWARRAGFADITFSASSWCFATPDERSWWGGLWAERLTRSGFARQAVTGGLASPDDLERLAKTWRRWSASDEGMFVVPHGEILCRR
ncbi:MAG TPA: methyltransferase domain-containing protein [Acidimicrobiales bacterium]